MYYKFLIIHLLLLKLFFQRYSITKKRAEKLELYRANNGPFESLDDLLELQNMKSKWVYNFYKSIICGKRSLPKKIVSGLIVTPRGTNQKVRRNQTLINFLLKEIMEIIEFLFLYSSCVSSSIPSICYRMSTQY